MAEYIFSKGVVRVGQNTTLKSDRWQPHALKPAFILLDVPSDCEPDEQAEEVVPEKGEQDDSHEAR